MLNRFYPTGDLPPTLITHDRTFRLIRGGWLACVGLLLLWGLRSDSHAMRAFGQEAKKELPSEAEIPGKSHPVKGSVSPNRTPAVSNRSNNNPSGTASADLFPDESVTIDQWQRRGRIVAKTLTQNAADANRTQSESAQRTLPDESALPGKTEPSTEQPPKPAGPQEAVQGAANGAAGLNHGANDSELSPGETRPFLRLSYEGHTERVRAIDFTADGRWVVSGGDDKLLHVWQRLDDRGWLHRRGIRWQIERGERGRIYRVAANGKLAAFAGHGASGGLGEIWIADITTGELSRVLADPQTAHRQTIADLSFAPGDRQSILSTDVEGRVVVWRPDPTTGIWKSKGLVDRDDVVFGAATARAMQPLRSRVPAAFVGPDWVVVSKLVGVTQTAPKAPLWRLELISVDGGQKLLIADSDHRNLVVSLAATEDGTAIASVDGDGKTRIWRFATAPGKTGFTNKRIDELPRPDLGHQPLELDWDNSGRKLTIAFSSSTLAAAASGRRGGVELWVANPDGPPTRTGEITSASPVIAMALAPAGDRLIYATGSQLRAHTVDAQGGIVNEPTQTLATPARPIREVAFINQSVAKESPDAKSRQGYRLAIGYGAGWEYEFDLSRVELRPQRAIDTAKLTKPQQETLPKWSVRGETTAAGLRYRLFLGDEPRARLPLDPQTHGIPTAIAVIEEPIDQGASPKRSPRTAIAIGSNNRSNIFVYQPPTQRSDQPPKLLRQFRVHSGAVNSLSVSPDAKYLASGSDDSTAAIWPLNDLWDVDPIGSFWGLDLESIPSGLEAAEVREDGPLFFRGVREGDVLLSIRWPDPLDPSKILEANEPKAITDALASMPFDSLVVFRWSRRGEPIAEFQSFPAWQPLAQLLVDREREWAMWTPAGLYDASVNGHRRFGWQINRGMRRLPDFYRADQLRQRLEKPEVLRRLLSRGSLASALLAADGNLAPDGEVAITQPIRQTPKIEWVGPDPTVEAVGDKVEIEATITLPTGSPQPLIKVYADGIAASRETLVNSVSSDEKRTERYRWTVPLISSRQNQIEILAATESGGWDRLTRTINHRVDAAAPCRKPRLHMIAVGVSDYGDPQIQKLDFAARGASELFSLVAQASASLYRFQGTRLLDRDAIRPMWSIQAEDTASVLARDTMPDDLIVLYLCGHGIRDPQTGKWYFVTADARHSDLMNDRYGDCLSFEDLSAFSRLPCRKLAILDSCHSGAVQPNMHTDDLKEALRYLQEDRILTVTASEGHQEAAEDRKQRLGRFTSRLIEGLAGQADASLPGSPTPDGTVTLEELITYVREKMAADSADDGFIQRPTAGPIDLLHSTPLPLTTITRPSAE